jgi:hypothetical protein
MPYTTVHEDFTPMICKTCGATVYRHMESRHDAWHNGEAPKATLSELNGYSPIEDVNRWMR